jgi:hypothetical protein
MITPLTRVLTKMFRIVTSKSFATHSEIEFITEQLRSTFSRVFTETYTERLHSVLEQALLEGEIKIAADTKKSKHDVVCGFSDLLVKPEFFSQPIAAYARRKVLHKALKKIYQGPGFDDDAAFILAFHDLDLSKTSSAEEHFNGVKNRLLPSLQQEVVDYFKILTAENRRLLKVDFLAVVNDSNQIQGFALLHLQMLDGKTILHVRQAAMLRQGFGFLSAMAAYMVNEYPYAIYEANQRKANQVLMKENLLSRQLINKVPAVLHYSTEYYFGWRGKNKIILLFLHYQKIKHPQKDLYTRGFWREAESIKPFFNPTRLNQDLFALQDDNFCKANFNYLRQPAFKRN